MESASPSEEAFATGENVLAGEPQAQGGPQPLRPGLDAGLARSCPDSTGLSQMNYRSFRRRIDVFEMCCRRRGVGVIAEGALLLLQSFTKEPWDACEAIDLNLLEGPQAFLHIRKALDGLYQYDETVEIPQRCEEFFQLFCRHHNETLQQYILRHQQMLTKMREIQVPVPEAMAAWHLLTRSAIPKWQEPTVRAAVSHQLTVQTVTERLKMMFGADSRPHAKDVARVQKALRGISGADALTMEDEWEEWHDSYDGGSVGGSVSYGDLDDEAYYSDDWDGYDDWGYGGDDYDDAYNYDDDVP